MLDDQPKATSSATLAKSLLVDFIAVRKFTERLCQPLQVEDFNLQAMAETSPVKWHLAHTSWFFETFILKQYSSDFKPFDKQYEYLFNSYYNIIGEQYPRPERGLLSRPTVDEVYRYRRHVTCAVEQLVNDLLASGDSRLNTALGLIRLGINHEQQHQELLLTDLKYNLFQNPLLPAYQSSTQAANESPLAPIQWIEFESELVSIGCDLKELPIQQAEFVFDNEAPRHQFYRQAFAVAHRLVTNGEYLEFIEQGGYRDPQYWLSDGWDTVCKQQWQAPLYWLKQGNDWFVYTLSGVQRLALNEPVTHISYYEADAFARWHGSRLLTEQEWESIADGAPEGNFLETERLQPQAATANRSLSQLFGDTWEWTSSAYSAYPGYRPAAGAVGEYNGKFMCNQYVLRGGSCVTSQSHIRKTYRNFFYPDARWQFSGIRLARNQG